MRIDGIEAVAEVYPAIISEPDAYDRLARTRKLPSRREREQ